MGLNDDGDFIPSYLQSTYSDPRDNGYTESLNEFTFRYGQIIAIYTTDKPGNQNKRFTEYDVSVFHKAAGGGSPAFITYRNCQTGSLFGGVADYFTYTFRGEEQNGNANQGDLSLNSMVLLLCINGNVKQATIIGGGNHPRQAKEDPDLGHHLDWEFNGIHAFIDSDGEFLLRRRGATKSDGTVNSPKDKNNGAILWLQKDGSITLRNGDSTQGLVIGGTSANQRNVDLTAKDHLNITSAGDIDISTTDEGVIKVGGDHENMVLGSTYRQNESQMFTKLSAQFDLMSDLLTTIASAVTSAAAAPGAQTLSAAGSGLVIVGSIMKEISSDIKAFEAQTNQYLSTTVFTG